MMVIHNQHYARQINYDLLQDMNSFLAEFEDDWNRRQTRKFTSIYPQPVVMIQSISEGGDAEDMSRSLEQIKELT